MNRQQLEAVTARWLAAVRTANLAEFEALTTPDVLDLSTGQRASARVFQERARALHDVFDGLTGRIEELVIEGDRLAWRWTLLGQQRAPFLGEPASGRAITLSGVNFQRQTGGRVSEHYTLFDALGAIRQMRGA